MDAAAEVARIAAAVAMRYFGGPLEIERKDDGSPVTLADRAAERAAREWIERRFPEDGILGEESGPVREGARRRWLIDPIDGTRSFIRGVPLWGSLVAIVEEGEVLAGAAEYPALRESLAAAPGLGCWSNGVRCRVSDVATLEAATVLTTDESFREAPGRRAGWERLASRTALVRSWGDCYGYLLVATGRAEVMVDPVLSPWDCAVLVPLIEEAGGVLTDWAGTHRTDGASAIATNARVAAAARRCLAADPTD
jgi:histidinol phosphatase-like enzyme (inositol monophosphatase family)